LFVAFLAHLAAKDHAQVHLGFGLLTDFSVGYFPFLIQNSCTLASTWALLYTDRLLFLPQLCSVALLAAVTDGLS
jgi:hypothetical protein